MKFAQNAKSVKQHVKENILWENGIPSGSEGKGSSIIQEITNTAKLLNAGHTKNFQSMDSDGLIELSEIYHKKQSVRCLKQELA
jgi:hypothetical protein